jgi:hypothetical protein
MQEWVGQQLAGGLAAADQVADQLPAGAAELVQQRRGRRPLRLIRAVPPERRDIVLKYLARAGCAAALDGWPGPGVLPHVALKHLHTCKRCSPLLLQALSRHALVHLTKYNSHMRYGTNRFSTTM